MHYMRCTSCLMFANLKKIERQGELGKHVELYCIYCKRNGVALPFARLERAWCRCYLAIETMFPSSKKGLEEHSKIYDLRTLSSVLGAKYTRSANWIDPESSLSFWSKTWRACLLSHVEGGTKSCALTFSFESGLSSPPCEDHEYIALVLRPQKVRPTTKVKRTMGVQFWTTLFCPSSSPGFFRQGRIFFVWQWRRPTSSPGRHIDFFQKSLTRSTKGRCSSWFLVSIFSA